MLKVGDYVIYQEQVCQIKEQKINEFTNLESFILVPVTDSSLKLNVPVNNPNIKNLMTKEEIKNLIALMPSIPLIDIEDKLLENEYKRLYHSGSKEDLIRIIKTTYKRNQDRLNNNKKISEKSGSKSETGRGFCLYLRREMAGKTCSSLRLYHPVSSK